MKTLLNFLFAFILCSACNAQSVKMGFNLIKGQTYIQKTQANMSIKQDMNGQPININMIVNGKMKFKVSDEINNIYSMDVSYDNLSMTMKMAGKSTTFDSEKNDEKDILSSVLGQIKNKPFQIKMTKTGKITEVANVEGIYDGVFERFPSLTEAQKAQLKNQITQSYGEKAFKSNLEMISAIFPDHKVAAGDTWNVKTQLESGMPVVVEGTYKLEEITDTQYIISSNSSLHTINKDTKSIQTAGMSLKFDLSGTMVSTLKIDKKTGWIVEGKISQHIKGNNQIEANEKMPNGMTIPMELTSEMVFTDN